MLRRDAWGKALLVSTGLVSSAGAFAISDGSALSPASGHTRAHLIAQDYAPQSQLAQGNVADGALVLQIGVATSEELNAPVRVRELVWVPSPDRALVIEAAMDQQVSFEAGEEGDVLRIPDTLLKGVSARIHDAGDGDLRLTSAFAYGTLYSDGLYAQEDCTLGWTGARPIDENRPRSAYRIFYSCPWEGAGHRLVPGEHIVIGAPRNARPGRHPASTGSYIRVLKAAQRVVADPSAEREAMKKAQLRAAGVQAGMTSRTGAYNPYYVYNEEERKGLEESFVVLRQQYLQFMNLPVGKRALAETREFFEPFLDGMRSELGLDAAIDQKITLKLGSAAQSKEFTMSPGDFLLVGVGETDFKIVPRVVGVSRIQCGIMVLPNGALFVLDPMSIQGTTRTRDEFSQHMPISIPAMAPGRSETLYLGGVHPLKLDFVAFSGRRVAVESSSVSSSSRSSSGSASQSVSQSQPTAASRSAD